MRDGMSGKMATVKMQLAVSSARLQLPVEGLRQHDTSRRALWAQGQRCHERMLQSICLQGAACTQCFILQANLHNNSTNPDSKHRETMFNLKY